MVELVRTLIETGILAGLALVGAVVFRSSFRWKWLVAALVLNLLYKALLTRGFWMIPDPCTGADWNWAGKLAAIAGTYGNPCAPYAWCGPRDAWGNPVYTVPTHNTYPGSYAYHSGAGTVVYETVQPRVNGWTGAVEYRRPGPLGRPDRLLSPALIRA